MSVGPALRSGRPRSAWWCAAALLASAVASVRAEDGAGGAVRVRRFLPKEEARGSYPVTFATTPKSYYFQTVEPGWAVTGVWRVTGRDGTPHVLRDFATSPTYQPVFAPVALGDTLCFGSGNALWRADDAAIPRAVVEFPESPFHAGAPTPIGRAGGIVVFSRGDAESGAEPWRTDGTPAGTWRLRDIAPGTASSSPWNGAAFGSTLFFVAEDPAHGAEPWRTDGTSEGTRLAVDLFPGARSSMPRFAGLLGDSMLVFGTGPDEAPTLWATRGTPSTTRVLHRAPGASYGGTVRLGDVLLFTTVGLDQSVSLWRTDGTAAETFEIASWASDFLAFLGAARGFAYFTAHDAEHGYELWRTDGTAEGTSLFADLVPGPGSSLPYSAAVLPDASGGVLVFAATTTAAGREMWRTDGTAEGTFLLADVAPGAAGSIDDFEGPQDYYAGAVAATEDAVWFAAAGAEGMELWVTDGTPEGTRLAGNLAADAASPGIRGIASSGGTLFLAAEEEGVGRELWTSDGTEEGTLPLTELTEGDGASWVLELTDLDGTLLFVGQGEAWPSTSLWSSDGTAASPVAAVPNDPILGAPSLLTRVGGLVFFRGGSKQAAWRSDGTAAGTFEVGGEESWGFTEFGGAAWYFRRYGGNWYELWTSDGTAEGTGAVRDLKPPIGQTGVDRPAGFGGRLWFPAYASADGFELWSTDGSTAGTRVELDLVPGEGSSIPQELTVVGGRLLFTAATVDPFRRELFAADAQGTVTRLWDLREETDTSRPQGLARVGDALFFAAPVSGWNAELWRSDGTPEGTTLVREIECGSAGSSPHDFLDVGGGRAVFVATDAAHGTELWTTDGTAEGTALVADVAPGPAPSGPSHLTLHDGAVWFAASADGDRTELWRVPVASLAGLTAPPACADDEPEPFPVPPAVGPEPAAFGPEPPVDPPAEPEALDVRSLAIRLPRTRAGHDAIDLSGRLPVPPDFHPKGATVRVEVGDVVSEFVLNRRGRAETGRRSRFELKLGRIPKGAAGEQDVPFSLALRRGDFSETLADEDLDPGPGGGRVVRTVVVTIRWRERTYLATPDLTVTRRRGDVRARLPRD